MITAKEIENLAVLARIEVNESEKESLAKDISKILEFVNQIQGAGNANSVFKDISSGAPINAMREDINPHKTGLYTEDLLSAVPARDGNYVKVKKIL